jgi:hypothetical protein
MKKVPNVPQNPYSEAEFEEFIKNIGNANIATWSIFAGTLGVSRKTITRWKKHPLAREAIAKAVSNAIYSMEKAGTKDWRMWREKLKMLGVKDRQNLELEIEPINISNILDSLGTSRYEEMHKQALEAFK